MSEPLAHHCITPE